MSILRIAALMLAATATASGGSIVFDFNALVVGTTTQFPDTVGGLTTTYSSPSDPGAFVVSQSFFTTLTGNILLQNVSGAVLSIDFSDPQSSVALSFATATVDPFEMDAYSGSTLLGSSTASGLVRSSQFPEGIISFSGGPFDRVLLFTRDGSPFAIDDVTAMPEPSSLLLIVFGFTALRGLATRFDR